MEDCIFCKIADGEIPSKFLYNDEDLMAIMDINPSCDGHVLIIPKNHYATIFDMPDELLVKSRNLAKDLIPKINKVTGYKGASLIYNYGDKQEIKHAHLHIVPDHSKKAIRSVDEIYNLIMEVKDEEII